MKTISRCLLAIGLFALFASAPRADSPNVYAIRGARIVTAATTTAATAAVLDSGTIVIRRGLIESVGASAVVPPDAEVIDGKGLTVYPGLIDLGNTRAADQPAPQQPQNLRTTADVERWKRSQILKPQARASDTVRVDSPDLAALAAAGITTVLATPPGDVMSGQSALINVIAPPDEPQIGNITEPRDSLLVLKTPVALHISFPARPRVGGSAYPESLMGVIALVRQTFLDAQHYQRVHAASDPALDALQPVLDRKIPVAFEANEAREILRALNLAREFKLDAIVTGARGAEDVTTDIKAQAARVVYSLNYPQRSRSLAPDADEPLRVLRQRAEAPRVPAQLAKAGVSFAFESAGLQDPKDFLKNAAKAVKAGLSPDTAIRALTINAAAIAGAADRIGSLEKGKTANLVVTDGDLFDDGTRIKHVFIGGRPVKPLKPVKMDEPGARSRSGAGAPHER